MQKRFYLSTRVDRSAGAAELLRALVAKGWQRTFAWDGEEPSNSGEFRALANAELAGIREADVLIVLLPGGRGTYTEIGAALAFGKPIILWAPDREVLDKPYPCAFHYHPNINVIVSPKLDTDAVLSLMPR
jgi:nucleoside 2-deoxyribosyltransferase